jgi:holo-[acyl-carrier protein] synthase
MLRVPTEKGVNQALAIIGTGVDMIEVERIRRALERPLTGERLRARVFSVGEARYCESRGVARYQSYAARFAAKEAAMKALGTGWGRGAGWRDFEVVRERGQAPRLTLSGKAALLAQRRNIRLMHLSLTHTTAHAIAYVIAES